MIGLAVGAFTVVRPDILSFSFGPLVTNCAEDDEIPSADRKAIEGQALAFVRLILDGDVEGAYARLSPHARAVTSLGQLGEGTRVIRADGPYGAAFVSRSYLIDLRVGRGHGETVACDTDKDSGGGDPPKLGTDRRQSNVVVIASNDKGQQSFTVWMNAVGAGWPAKDFTSSPPPGEC